MDTKKGHLKNFLRYLSPRRHCEEVRHGNLQPTKDNPSLNHKQKNKACVKEMQIPASM